jgi:beta-glucosidase
VAADDLAFPEGFAWGAATSAYQIEGGVREDGRGDSIWDAFSRRPGAILDGSDGDVAADHFHLYPQDVQLMHELGLRAYRFSIGWPRIVPDGSGPANARGLDLYERLVEELLGAGIEPWVTLYHWDLPLALEARGGWRDRDTVDRFVEYALHVHGRLADRVPVWLVLNEPWCSAFLGYATDVHAPGACDPAGAVAAAHHLLLAHGRTVRALRAAAGDAALGSAINLVPVHPASDAEADVDAARRIDGLQNRLWLDALLHGRYPDDVVADLAPVTDLAHVHDGDLAEIAAPIDLLGVNYYYSWAVAGDGEPRRPSEWVGSEHVRFVPQALPVTAMDWSIDPDGLRDTLRRVAALAPGLALAVTENGAAYPRADDDADRLAYLDAHLRAVHAAIADGVDVRGYMVWSLLDNFEWGWGYGQRFGIVDVDYPTQRRTPRRSARWYADVARANALPAAAFTPAG